MAHLNIIALSGVATRDAVLREKSGGRGVSPYQPSGIWEAVAYTSSDTAHYKQSKGDGLYRRSVYTFWKRTAPPPAMMSLDAPTRETCAVRRTRTNTPMGALTLMNDIQFVEAARNLAQRAMLQAPSKTDEQLAYAFRLATSRRADASDMTVLRRVYDLQLAEFKANTEAAKKLLEVGDSPWNESLDAAELAAMTMVANLILNLDETVTKG